MIVYSCHFPSDGNRWEGHAETKEPPSHVNKTIIIWFHQIYKWIIRFLHCGVLQLHLWLWLTVGLLGQQFLFVYGQTHYERFLLRGFLSTSTEVPHPKEQMLWNYQRNMSYKNRPNSLKFSRPFYFRAFNFRAFNFRAFNFRASDFRAPLKFHFSRPSFSRIKTISRPFYFRAP